MRDQKVITYSQEKIEVQRVYSVEPVFVSSLLKKEQNFSKMSEAIPRPLENKVKKEKKADVKKLMGFFKLLEDAKDIYACVLDNVEEKCRTKLMSLTKINRLFKPNKNIQLNFCYFFGIIECSIYLYLYVCHKM